MDGTWFSEWDGYVTDLTSELHIDHVVALAEAWDSGANAWTAGERDEFADYLPNLLAVTATENLRKSDEDAAEWFPSRAEANCLWSSTVVRVKAHWHLSVDQAEHDALANLLRSCSDYIEPTTTHDGAANDTATADDGARAAVRGATTAASHGASDGAAAEQRLHTGVRPVHPARVRCRLRRRNRQRSARCRAVPCTSPEAIPTGSTMTATASGASKRRRAARPA